jgi:hypothetical protein
MRRILTYTVLALAMATAGCSDNTEEPGCDQTWGYAQVTGVARDFDGAPMDSAEVEFFVANDSHCPSEAGDFVHSGITDENGNFEVLLRVANARGERCVRGRVARSEAVAERLVRFSTDCDPPVPTFELDLIATPSAVIPTDLRISLYRLHSCGMGPHYQVLVDATGSIQFEGINNTIVSSAVGSAELTALARLYRAFENLGYWNIKTLYSPEECSFYATDIHYSSTSLRADGREHAVLHDHGCCGIPVFDDLTDLECTIDDVLGTIQWTGSEAAPCGWAPGRVCPPTE